MDVVNTLRFVTEGELAQGQPSLYESLAIRAEATKLSHTAKIPATEASTVARWSTVRLISKLNEGGGPAHFDRSGVHSMNQT